MKVLLIGGTGVGKTTLKQRLSGQELLRKKTQMIEFNAQFIDCPGEYLEIPRYYHVLIDMSFQVDEVWALVAADSKQSIFPPNFAKSFNRKVIGIITKIDKGGADSERARNFLLTAGISENVYPVCALSGKGCAGLARRLNKMEEQCLNNTKKSNLPGH